MSTAQVTVQRQLDRILQDSIDHEQRLVLTHNSAQGWRTFKSQFVSGSAQSRLIQVSASTPLETPVHQILRPGDTLGVTFRSGHKKCMFSTTIESIQHETDTAMVTISWPDQIQQLQRRAYQRVKPPEDVVIAVRFWRQEGAAGVPVEGRTVRYGQLEDLSAGGLRIKVADPEGIQLGMAFRCVFEPHPGKPPLILDVFVRHREAADCGRASIGFQAVGLEATPEGRRTLERLARTVSRFHRAQSRKRR